MQLRAQVVPGRRLEHRRRVVGVAAIGEAKAILPCADGASIVGPELLVEQIDLRLEEVGTRYPGAGDGVEAGPVRVRQKRNGRGACVGDHDEVHRDLGQRAVTRIALVRADIEAALEGRAGCRRPKPGDAEIAIVAVARRRLGEADEEPAGTLPIRPTSSRTLEVRAPGDRRFCPRLPLRSCAGRKRGSTAVSPRPPQNTLTSPGPTSSP